jgi:DNA polymerase-1
VTRIALIDSDIVAYKVAASSETKFDFAAGGGTTAKIVDRERAWKMCDELIAEYAEAVKADSVVVCLGDPDANWRKQLEPTYKLQRVKAEKPALLFVAKEYMFEEYRSYVRPRLEADDVMGILATRPELLGKGVSDVVIVSEDKDMRTLPAKVYNPNKPSLGIIEPTPLEAKQFHMWQTICGDQTDNYPGAKGIGEKSVYAEDVLVEDDLEELWDTVVLAFFAAGHGEKSEEAAIHQARLARILHCHDYNFETKGIRLWNPTCLYW